MCEATTIIAVVSTLYSVNETRQNAKRQERALMAQQAVEQEEMERQVSAESL